MNIRLPNNAKVTTSKTSNRTIIKIPRMLGWDILQLVAECNITHVIDFAKQYDVSVYQDHIMLDSNLI